MPFSLTGLNFVREPSFYRYIWQRQKSLPFCDENSEIPCSIFINRAIVAYQLRSLISEIVHLFQQNAPIMTNINSEQAECPMLDFDCDAINRFFKKLVPKHSEPRTCERIPFCWPVTIYFDEEPIPVSGLVRDISQTGIGMTHECPFSPQEATIRISDEDGCAFCARIEILWCRNVTRGFYISGGQFVRVFESDPLLNRKVDRFELEL